MDARTAESPVTSPSSESWLQRERASGRFYDRAVGRCLRLFLVAMIGLSAWLLARGGAGHHLVAATDRAAAGRDLAAGDCADGALCPQARGATGGAGGLGSGRLHVRLVALVHGHCRSADGSRRDFRVAAFPEWPGILVLRSCAKHVGEHRAGRSRRLPRRSAGVDRSHHHGRRLQRIIFDKIPIDDPRFADVLA